MAFGGGNDDADASGEENLNDLVLVRDNIDDSEKDNAWFIVLENDMTRNKIRSGKFNELNSIYFTENTNTNPHFGAVPYHILINDELWYHIIN